MNWDWFYAMYSIAAVFMIVEFVWKFAMIPLGLVSVVFNKYFQNIYIYLISLIPYYFMASYAALIGLGVNEGEKSISILVISGLYFLMTGLFGIAQQQNDASKQGDYETYHFTGYKYYGFLAAVVFYVYAIFDHRPAVNYFTIRLTDFMSLVQGIPFLGWIIAAIAFFHVISVIIMFITMIIGLAATAVSKSS